ncbi:MAG: PAS domain S-box protein [Anaerolineales bacterium]
MRKAPTFPAEGGREEFLETLINQSEDGMMVIDAGGIVQFANPAAERMFSAQTDQLVGYQIGIPAVDKNVELHLPQGDQVRTVEMRTSEVLWKDQTTLLTTLRDITDRVEAESELRERVKELRCLSAVSAVIQKEFSLKTVCQKTVDQLAFAMQFPGLAVPVIELGGERCHSGGYRDDLSHELQADIKSDDNIYGHISVYYTEDKPFLIPQEQDLLDQIAEMLALWYEERETQKKLQESKERLELAVQSAELGIWDWKIKEDAVQFDETFIGILGYGPDEVEGMIRFLTDHIHPEDRQSVLDELDRHMGGETSIYQVLHRLHTKDGDWVHVLDTGKVVEWDSQGDPARFIGVGKDITDLVEAEENLRFQAHLLDAVGQAVIATDHTGKVVYWNQAAETLYGWSADEVHGKNILDVTPADAFREQAEEITSTLAEGETWSGEFEVKRRDGSTIHALITETPIMDETGEVKWIIGVTTDITERVEAEQAQRLSKQRFKALIENAQDMITVVDKDGTVLYNSPSLEDVLGYTPEEHEGQKAFEYVHPDDLPDLARYLQERMDKSGESGRIEYRMKHKDGAWRAIESVGRNALDDPSVGGIVINSRDVTDRRRYEQLIERQVQRFSILHTIASLGVETNDENVVMEKTTELIEKAFSPKNCGVLFLNEREGVLEHHASYRTDEQYQPIVAQLGQGIVGIVAERGEPMNIPDVRRFEEYREVSPEVRSELCVPLVSGDHTLGVINLESSEVGAFSMKDERMLVALANQLASVIDKIRSRQESEQRMMRLQVLQEVEQAISGSLDLKTVLNVLIDRLVRSLEVDAGGILLYQPATQHLEYVAGQGFRTEAVRKTSVRMGEGQAGKVAYQRKTIHLPDLSLEADSVERNKMFHRENIVAYVGVPLVAKGKIVGVLEVFHRSPLDPSRDWMNFLKTLANQAATAINNAQLFEDLQRSNFELIQTYNATLEGWARALEFKDQETEGHARRVIEMTMALVDKLGIEEKHLAHIRWGALLHDIGKMGIPDRILQKEGSLNEEEWELMRQHPEFAYDLLSEIDYLKPALDIPYCHHEKWDGTGYPQGLEGEEIPLSARVFAVADVWDALRSDRPYRDAWPDEKAISYITQQAGKHFDPAVVEAFLEIINA